MRSRRSIRSLLVALLAVFALFLVGTGTYSVISTYRVSARHAEEVALNIAEVTAVSTRLFVDDTRAMLERLAAASDLDSENPACEEWIESAVLLRPRYSNVVVADAEGRPICSTTQNVQRRRSGAGRPWFETVRTAREFTIGMPERGLLTGRWITIFAYPLSGPEGSFVGAVGVSVELDKFRTLVSGATLPADAVITLSHLDGTVIARSSDHEDWGWEVAPLFHAGPRCGRSRNRLQSGLRCRGHRPALGIPRCRGHPVAGLRGCSGRAGLRGRARLVGSASSGPRSRNGVARSGHGLVLQAHLELTRQPR